MNTQYYLQKIPVEAVEPGYSLAIRDAVRTGGAKFRLFQVEGIEVSRRGGQPVTVTLTSDTAATLQYEAGTPVVRLFGICARAAS
ncbi:MULTISPECIES: hypothetical protein [Mycobacterium]|uniref:Uncharacterized protein n=1 Tax=Mycobacterium kiyosense TaxID=2871094 RepID=A0A9P3UZ93_9MYCO|nr:MULTISPECIES: hypothetical protein [Mycobacterium]BDB44743.1 hypothetical protein IWGMT90018_51890 [Mycobacterium kiyosense]BDE16239.1 hypothetical protein MKCMC460_50990 [Mycobacterium sp. 20KCMC460]GLB86063.1 hypothetical protein SRL2020028_53190 [Mycobacterium kiyosense]GLB92774.1 hypothetical protein SRL2020130_55910 [Mycobacterium kiyosense]GLB98689.1 hypothetical protein SRL2020226_54650 [Mycobacterium kiyosense]